MSNNSIIYICIFVGSTIGSFIPNLWGAGFLSISSIIFSAIGGLIGLYLASKLI